MHEHAAGLLAQTAQTPHRKTEKVVVKGLTQRRHEQGSEVVAGAAALGPECLLLLGWHDPDHRQAGRVGITAVIHRIGVVPEKAIHTEVGLRPWQFDDEVGGVKVLGSVVA